MTTPTSPFAEAAASGADASKLAHIVVDTIAKFNEGQDVQFDFLTKDAVGAFCTSLGIKRNWAELDLDTIAPADEFDVNVAKADESDKILGLVASLIEQGELEPKKETGEAYPTIINDFLSKPKTFQGEDTLGHEDEFAYALAVELEHGRDRGTNVTMNHPLLTALVVLAHLAEDSLYYARLRVMEAEGELFNGQLEGKPAKELKDLLETVVDARQRLAARQAEKIEKA